MSTGMPVVIPNLVGYAIAYARRGWPVFPLHSAYSGGCSCGKDCGRDAGKHPRTEHGLNDATTDEATIRGWWQRWPDANIGISTGPADLVVIDIDPRNGGDATWSALVVSNDPIGLTTAVHTGSGGEHVYLRAPAYPVRSKADGLGPGVDVKSSGGYVVAPPSSHASGNRYEWRQGARPDEADVAACPQWILDRLERKKTRGHRPDSRLASAFAAAGMLGRKLPDGQWSVRCPWEDAHSSSKPWRDTDSSTVILPATSEHPRPRFHCSHAHCSGRTTADAMSRLPRAAVEAAEQEWGADAAPESEERESQTDDAQDAAHAEPDADWRADLITKKDGSLVGCEANAITILAHDSRWSGVLAWDSFAQRLTFRKPPPWGVDETPADTQSTWQDEDATRLMTWLHRRWSVRLSSTAAAAAAAVVGRRFSFHPVREWLLGLRWDGERRVDSWLCDYVGAEPTEYHRAVGRMFLVAAVARIMRPGCKVDTMPILEGRQGLGKSRALRALFGEDWLSDTPLDLEDKDRFVALRGRWCVELAELDSMRRAEATRVKSFLSSPSDTYRPPYGRESVDIPRQCVFAGTTNADTYLRDETGSRRFWPVRCGAIDLPGLAAAREQLWAEAKEAFLGGAPWWPEGDIVTACRAETEDRAERDSWSDILEPWLARQPVGAFLQVADILRDVFDIEKGRQDQSAQNRVARALRTAGWRRSRETSGARRWGYVAPVPVCPSVEFTTGTPIAQ